MHDWLKKNQKKLLAVLGAFLMVSFLVTVPLGSLTSSSGGKGAPIGKFGKTVLYENDRRRAAALWRMLEGSYSVTLLKEREQILAQDDETRKQYKDFGEDFGERMIQMQRARGMRPTPPSTVSPLALLDPARPGLIMSQMKDHPELFLLLVKEAEQRGISVSTDRLREALKNEIMQDPEMVGKDVSPAAYEEAVRDFLEIQALRDLVLNDAKLSEPTWEHFFTEACRVERLNRVEYSADVAAIKTPPTTQQVQTQYDEFKNVDPDEPNKPANDPLGFGYFEPNRVKVQYLTVTRKDVLAYFVKRVNDIAEPPVLKIWLLSQARNWFWLFNPDLPFQKKAWDQYNENKENYGLEYTAQQLEQKCSQIEEQARHLFGARSAAAESIAKAAESDARRAARDAQTAQQAARTARDPQSEESARMKSVSEALTKIQSAKEAIDTAGKELAQAQIEAAKPATSQPFGPLPLPATTKPAIVPTTRPAATHPTTAPSSAVDVPTPCGDPTILALATEPSTGPATAAHAATQPAASPPATAPAAVASTEPATTQSVSQDEDQKIFEQFSDEIVGAGLKSEIDKMEADVASAIRNKMLDDWHSGGTALPISSAEYLPEVAKFIQGQYKILPQFTQLPNWLTARQGKELPGIGASVALETDLYGQWPFFRIGLAVWEPSQIINDDTGDVHVFRFTDASPAHPRDLHEEKYPFVAWNYAWGPPMHPMLTKVEEDTKLKLAYNEAKARAEHLVQRVKSGESLTKAARADAKEPTLTDYFSRDTAQQRHISSEVAAEAEKLLAKASDKDPNPISIIEMPASREVLVVQLDHVMIQVPEELRGRGVTLEDLRFREKLRRSEAEEARTGNALAESYFTFDAVSKRMGYQPEATSKSGS